MFDVGGGGEWVGDGVDLDGGVGGASCEEGRVGCEAGGGYAAGVGVREGCEGGVIELGGWGW